MVSFPCAFLHFTHRGNIVLAAELFFQNGDYLVLSVRDFMEDGPVRIVVAKSI